MNEIVNEAQPYITAIVLALIGLLTTVILRSISILQKRVTIWIDSRQSVSERELLHKIAAEAFAIAEKEVSGATLKYNAAFAYTSDRLGKAGIKVSSDEIKASIEKAVLDYNAKTKTSA
ncbi:hypothetical protein KIH86_23860 [Paenibacillus sp. HN-1]|uniref:phage holin, LLH family n=1 Tax=Paenibacillus TaxID=44249 RepID=UPI001CA9C59C|nr:MULTISPECIES: phage holin, LLH family [Paenibacillus]MBY9081188.1 hypothetical protein [Paenibacillus sp. CGMCC 1.18879]MBY9087225.1 hypothetical protein [Paenibacillus sinensis]